jgi:hypothetical protein
VVSLTQAEYEALNALFLSLRKGYYVLLMARSISVCLYGRNRPCISQKEHTPPVRFSVSLLHALTLTMNRSPDKNPGVKGVQERFARLGVVASILRSEEGRERSVSRNFSGLLLG